MVVEEEEAVDVVSVAIVRGNRDGVGRCWRACLSMPFKAPRGRRAGCASIVWRVVVSIDQDKRINRRPSCRSYR